MSAVRVLAIYRVAFSALIVLASVQTLRAAGADNQGVRLLASVEIAGALMLCSRRAQWPGAVVLLGVFACAQLLAMLSGEWPTRFLQFAASALLIFALDRALAPAR